MADTNLTYSFSTEKRIKYSVNQKLVESGEKERLKEQLRTKLVECGWRDEMKNYAREVIKSKGLENITVDELIAEISPHGKSIVPPQVKQELLQRIRKFINTNA